MIRDVIVKDASNKGLGVFALQNFAKGEFIFLTLENIPYRMV